MSKVGAEISVTLRIGGPTNNEYVKMRVSIDEVDTEQPVQDQLDRAFGALDPMFKSLNDSLEERIQREIGRQL